MTAPKRVQMTRQRPWRPNPPDAVIVDRRTAWGNSWTVDDFAAMFSGDLVQARAWCAHKFRTGYVEVLGFDNNIHDRLGYPPNTPVIDIVRVELVGRDLACWCPLDQPCHADVLLELANGSVT